MGRTHRAGVSLLELLIVVAIIAALVGVGSVSYRGMLEEGRRERARSDLRTLAKGVLKLESDQQVTVRPADPHPQMEPAGLGVNDNGGFKLDRLLDFRILANLPSDPWGMQYEIDAKNGEVYSNGPDTMPDSGDEIAIPFRPDFEFRSARFVNDRHSIEAEFTRKIDPFSVNVAQGSIPFILAGGAPAVIEKGSRHMTNPFAVVLRLDQRWPPGVPATLTPISDPVGETGLEAMDTAFLEETPTLDIKDF